MKQAADKALQVAYTLEAAVVKIKDREEVSLPLEVRDVRAQIERDFCELAMVLQTQKRAVLDAVEAEYACITTALQQQRGHLESAAASVHDHVQHVNFHVHRADNDLAVVVTFSNTMEKLALFNGASYGDLRPSAKTIACVYPQDGQLRLSGMSPPVRGVAVRARNVASRPSISRTRLRANSANSCMRSQQMARLMIRCITLLSRALMPLSAALSHSVHFILILF